MRHWRLGWGLSWVQIHWIRKVTSDGVLNATRLYQRVLMAISSFVLRYTGEVCRQGTSTYCPMKYKI